ncbi:hypothetical protein HPB51_001507 [Rhipicephalus microplus]|uniref:Uncharacterized protein n=1 Tax=Rhipicephalus microplus TaxID=6941 RepID=A0A9J6EVT0_RHIMP|nr:hypothetical protein HPB51_001507 [Rhipicephalus microplus]
MMFCVAAQLKYSLESVVRVTYFDRTKLYLLAKPICPLDDRNTVDIASTVEAVQAMINTTVTTKQVVVMAKQLCQNVSRVPEKLATYNLRQGTSKFSREIWNVDEFEAALEAHGLLFKNVQNIRVRGEPRIRFVYNLFAGDALDGSKAAYLIWHAVHLPPERTVGIVPSGALNKQSKGCRSEKHVCYRGKRREGTVKKSALFDPEDADTLEGFFENVTLLTPTFASSASLRVPTATSNFARNILNGRNYNLDLTTARLSVLAAKTMTRYRDLHLVENRFLLLSSAVYNFIRTDTYSAWLPNMAVLGQLMTEGLWAMALRNIRWNSRTHANI